MIVDRKITIESIPPKIYICLELLCQTRVDIIKLCEYQSNKLQTTSAIWPPCCDRKLTLKHKEKRHKLHKNTYPEYKSFWGKERGSIFFLGGRGLTDGGGKDAAWGRNSLLISIGESYFQQNTGSRCPEGMVCRSRDMYQLRVTHVTLVV